jgi:YD repeat-containing protein
MYYGSSTLATDAAGNNRQSQTDAMGRLAEVWENQTSWKGLPTGQSGQPTYTTTYGYDALDDLTSVTAMQSRSFSYDSLKRLYSATNPESGTISYTYDASGNVGTRSSLRSLTATMTYDGMNRILTKQFSDAGSASPTPWIAYSYDQGGSAVNALGHPTQVQSAQTTVSWGTLPQITRSYSAFDKLGRVTASSQSMAAGAPPYTYSYAYDLAGEMTSEGYPSGRTLAMGYDVAGRPASVAGTLNAATTNYATLPSDPTQAYTQYGTLYHLPLLSGVTETSAYNNRMQLTGLTAATGSATLLTLGFSYGSGGTNNGNMLGQTIRNSDGLNVAQTYLYDAFNRLCAGGEGVSWTQSTTCSAVTGTGASWWQAYSFDQAGNRAVAGTMENANWTPQSRRRSPQTGGCAGRATVTTRKGIRHRWRRMRRRGWLRRSSRSMRRTG